MGKILSLLKCLVLKEGMEQERSFSASLEEIKSGCMDNLLIWMTLPLDRGTLIVWNGGHQTLVSSWYVSCHLVSWDV